MDAAALLYVMDGLKGDGEASPVSYFRKPAFTHPTVSYFVL